MMKQTTQSVIDPVKQDIEEMQKRMNEIEYKLSNAQTTISDLSCILIKLNQHIEYQQRIHVTWLAVLTGVAIALLIAVIS